MRRRERTLGVWTVTVIGVGALFSCTDRELKPLQTCLVSTLEEEVTAEGVTAVDLLFVVDNSGSMKEEQASLRREFPKLIQVLTTGERPGQAAFSPVKDLHLAVVSTDMGLVGVDGVTGCTGFGDDGVMNNAPNASVPNCQASYPRFLTYLEGVDDPTRTANDFACISTLGTEGCGFEQPLESALKALWPSADERVRFLGDATGFGTLGRGDAENLGFLRGTESQGSSLLAIIVVSDEEDCSSADTSHLVPEEYLPLDSPLRAQDLNLRCFHNPQNLYAIDRYVKGFREARPGENRVVFGAIVGVPQDLVDADALARAAAGDAAREAFYDGILADPRMQQVPDPTSAPGDGNLTPSCSTPNGVAYPPRRIVEVARRFGDQGVVQSICQDDFGPAMDAILALIADNLTLACLPRPLVRDADGIVGCDVVWELPAPGTAAPGTPVACSDRPYLAVPSDRATATANGGAVCKVQQLAVADGVVQASTNLTDGWYYDDFSPGVARDCAAARSGRVAFTDHAQPEAGIVVKIACLDEAPHLTSARTDLAPAVHQPMVGDGCDEGASGTGTTLSGDAACAVTLASGATDGSMFCHPEWNVCVRGCATDADCPAAWVCDARSETLAASGRAMCVNPTCGEVR